MGGYRLYFRRLDAIIGRHDFVAEDDIFALAVAAQVWRACSDLADAFELWTGERRVDSPGLKLPMPATMAEVTQKCVRQAEEALFESHWAIGRSHRLRNYVAQARVMAGRS